MILSIVGIVVGGLGLAALFIALSKEQEANANLDQAIRRNAQSDRDLREADRRYAQAEESRKAEESSRLEAIRIESSLIHPRFVVNPRGEFRVLGAREDREEGESFCREPERNCRECWGRGYTKRNRDTGEAIMCKCTKERK